jgi:membrane protease YdiL (CAAX protease family)
MMTSQTKRWLRNRSLFLFFLLAYVISWGIEVPLALQAQGVLPSNLPFSLHYLAGYGPMMAAWIMTRLVEGGAGLRELFGRMLKWRLKPVWWLAAIAPLAIYLLVGIISWLAQGTKLEPGLLGQVDFLPGLGLAALPLWILTFGIGEETGWRGYALPRLQNGRNALSATFVLWILWALWHLPLFFYLYTVSILPGFLTGLLAGAIVFTWLYNSTGGSILVVAVWHGAFNFVTACTACKTGASAAIVSALVMLWAVLVVILYKPAGLVKAKKQAA